MIAIGVVASKAGVEALEYTTPKLKIIRDSDPLNPRKDWDNASIMACWHRRYTLGDVQPKESPEEWMAENVPAGSIVLPLYLYDHGGITMSTGAFSCPWDSGQVGVIVMSPDKIRECFMVKSIDEATRERATQGLISEVKVYDEYLRGNCWGYVYDNGNGEEDSCWGFIGDLSESGLAESIPEEAKPLLKEAWDSRYDG